MLETLHILDMSQGLHKEGGAGLAEAAPKKQKQRRLPNITEQIPRAAEEPQDPVDRTNQAAAPQGADPGVPHSLHPISGLVPCPFTERQCTSYRVCWEVQVGFPISCIPPQDLYSVPSLRGSAPATELAGKFKLES